MISSTTEYVLLGLAVVAYGAVPPLRRALSSRTRVRPQPVSDVTAADVERIVRRDFSEGQFVTVMAILDEYDPSKSESGRSRVQLAALKLAGGDTDKLRINIDAAKRDYRDVLVPAEYPQHSTSGFRGRKPPARERQKLIDLDWKQYERWLRR
jgi:multidrug efflux pump subunit AcrA (membrane-fusion protein)